MRQAAMHRHVMHRHVTLHHVILQRAILLVVMPRHVMLLHNTWTKSFNLKGETLWVSLFFFLVTNENCTY